MLHSLLDKCDMLKCPKVRLNGIITVHDITTEHDFKAMHDF